MVVSSKYKIIKYKKQDAKYTKVKKQKRNYYNESITALKEYMMQDFQNPTEKDWNNYAIKNGYLTSKTLGYLSEIGFNSMCRKIRIEINSKSGLK